MTTCWCIEVAVAVEVRLSVATCGMRRFSIDGDECLCCVRLRYRLFSYPFLNAL